jgi:preprotein translocase subunit SecG
MEYVIAGLLFLACVALVLLVIVQRSKGGGLATNLQGGAALAQQMGMRKATDFVEKATWYCMGAIAVLAVVANIAIAASAGEAVDTNVPRSIQAARNAPISMPQAPEMPSNPQEGTPQNGR